MLNKIIEYQKAHGLSNQSFADRIGYNRTSWIRVKTGRAPLNNKLLQRIESAFPDIFLPIKTTTVVDSGNLPSADEKPHGQKLGVLKRLIDKLSIRKYILIVGKPHSRKLGGDKNDKS